MPQEIYFIGECVFLVYWVEERDAFFCEQLGDYFEMVTENAQEFLLFLAVGVELKWCQPNFK